MTIFFLNTALVMIPKNPSLCFFLEDDFIHSRVVQGIIAGFEVHLINPRFGTGRGDIQSLSAEVKQLLLRIFKDAFWPMRTRAHV